jgi:predicted O-methyltransferase YrrM
MLRILSILAVTALLACSVGDPDAKKKDIPTVTGTGTLTEGAPDDKGDAKADAILELTLPESETPPEYAPERVSELLIDGKDFSKPRNTKRTVAVALKKGADSVKVKYTFWPNTYTRFIRTKVVKVEKGKTVKVNLLKAQEDDQIWVIFVPTPDKVVDEMCKLAKIKKGDVVYDIGCGDGRLVIHAVKKYGAKKGIGIDLDPDRIKDCKANAKKAGVSDKVEFLQKDALKIKEFSEANVVLIYLSEELNKALRPKLRSTLKPGARVVSHRFLMGDWEPDKTIKLTAKDNYGEDDQFELHLWNIKKK